MAANVDIGRKTNERRFGARWKFLKPIALCRTRNRKLMGREFTSVRPQALVGQVRSPCWETNFPLRRRRSPDRIVLAGTVALDVYLHNLLVEEGSRSARNLSYNSSDQTDRSLQSVLSIVSKLVERLQGDGVGSASALESAAVEKALKGDAARSPGRIHVA